MRFESQGFFVLEIFQFLLAVIKNAKNEFNAITAQKPLMKSTKLTELKHLASEYV